MKFFFFFFFIFLFFFLQFHKFIIGALNYTGASLCAASFNLPRAYNALLGGALVMVIQCYCSTVSIPTIHLKLACWVKNHKVTF